MRTASHPRRDGLVAVRFGLVRSDDSRAPVDGWPPPVECEELWARPVGDGRYRIENTPWFVENLARGDVIEAVTHEGALWMTRKAEWSGRLTVRVTGCEPGFALDAFADLGVGGESAGPAYRLAVLDIPPDADFPAIHERLRAGRSDGAWDYEEACVSAEWRSLSSR